MKLAAGFQADTIYENPYLERGVQLRIKDVLLISAGN